MTYLILIFKIWLTKLLEMFEITQYLVDSYTKIGTTFKLKMIQFIPFFPMYPCELRQWIFPSYQICLNKYLQSFKFPFAKQNFEKV